MTELSPYLPPILRASIWCNGYNVTASMIDQTIRFKNGERIVKHSTANAPINAMRINVSDNWENCRRSNSRSRCATGDIGFSMQV